jgi:hypothetical protein
VQVKVYVTVPASVGVSVAVPIGCWLPLQPPLALQEVAWVLDQVNVVDCPTVMVAGVTEMLTVGGAGGVLLLPLLFPPPPQACNNSATAAATAGRRSLVRRLVIIADMLLILQVCCGDTREDR